MIAQVPASFLDHAKRHLRQTGCPLVCGPRRRLDIGLAARPNPGSARWALFTDTSTLPTILQEAVHANESNNELMLRLTKYATIAVSGLPSVFKCVEHVVGQLEVCDGVPFLTDAVTLSCFSYVLRHHEPRTGFFVRVVVTQLRSQRGR